MNVVLLTGVATDAQLRYTPNGKPILNFRIAGVRTIQRGDGQTADVFSSHIVSLYGERAERWAALIGDDPLPQAVHAQARLRSYATDQPDGSKRYGTSIDIDQLHFLPGDHEIRQGEYGPLLVGGASRALLLGNVTRDGELRYTSNGNAVANLNIAVNEYNPVTKESRGNFITVTAWGEALANTAAECTKGTPVRVAGAVVLSSWDDRDGNKRYQLRVNADEILRLASPAYQGDDRPARTAPATAPATGTRPAAPAKPAARQLDIDEEFPPEEDLPF